MTDGKPSPRAAADLALYNVMRTADGREVLFDILHREAEVNRSSFVGENPLTASYRAGKREVGLALQKRMNEVDVGLVRLMEDEAMVRAQAQKGRK